MEELFNHIELASKNNAYWVALIGILTLPDICSSLESQDGYATKQKCIDWFDKWVSTKYFINGEYRLNGTICYSYRCAIVHQGKAIHRNMNYDKIIFLHPKTKGINMHMTIAQNTLSININEFISEVITSAKEWNKSAKLNESFQKNYAEFMKLYPNGKKPIFVIPLIG